MYYKHFLSVRLPPVLNSTKRIEFNSAADGCHFIKNGPYEAAGQSTWPLWCVDVPVKWRLKRTEVLGVKCGRYRYTFWPSLMSKKVAGGFFWRGTEFARRNLYYVL